jgi:hypothetical protein
MRTLSDNKHCQAADPAMWDAVLRLFSQISKRIELIRRSEMIFQIYPITPDPVELHLVAGWTPASNQIVF